MNGVFLLLVAFPWTGRFQKPDLKPFSSSLLQALPLTLHPDAGTHPVPPECGMSLLQEWRAVAW